MTGIAMGVKLLRNNAAPLAGSQASLKKSPYSALDFIFAQRVH
jgi:hypothetical protein